MNSLAKPIKAQIVADLKTLKTSRILGSVIELADSKDPLSIDIPAYPAAIVGFSAMKSDASDTNDNIRTYTFPIFVIEKLENITAATDMEDLRDAIINVLDTDYTLAGTAVGGVLPNTSPLFTKSTPDRTIKFFLVEVAARALYKLGT